MVLLTGIAENKETATTLTRSPGPSSRQGLIDLEPSGGEECLASVPGQQPSSVLIPQYGQVHAWEMTRERHLEAYLIAAQVLVLPPILIAGGVLLKLTNPLGQLEGLIEFVGVPEEVAHADSRPRRIDHS